MSDTVDALNVEIGGDSSGLVKALTEGITKLGAFGEASEVAMNLLTGPAGMVAGIVAVGMALNDMDLDFAAAQKSEILFQTAIGNAIDPTGTLADKAELAVTNLEGMAGATKDSAEQLVTFLASTGRTGSQIDEITTAAIGLSNATGLSLSSAMTQLDKTFSGVVGKLAVYDPALKDLTKDQLENGAGVDAIYAKYGKFADVLDTSASQSIAANKQALQGLSVAIGQDVDPAFQDMRDMFTNLAINITDFIYAIDNPTGAIAGIESFLTAIADLLRLDFVGYWRDQGKAFDDFTGKLPTYTLPMAQYADQFVEFEGTTKTVTQTATDSIIKNLNGVDSEIKAGVITESQGINDKIKIRQTYIDKLLAEGVAEGGLTDTAKTEIDKQKKAIDTYLAYLSPIPDNIATITQSSAASVAAGVQADMDASLKGVQTNAPAILYQYGSIQQHITDATAKATNDSGQLWVDYRTFVEKENGKISNSIKDDIEAGLTDVGKALVTGGPGWTDLAKLALDSIAQVLQGLGKELIALAAVDFSTGHYAEGIVAAAGATAAFVGSGVLEGLASQMDNVATTTAAAGQSLNSQLGGSMLSNLQQQLIDLTQTYTTVGGYNNQLTFTHIVGSAQEVSAAVQSMVSAIQASQVAAPTALQTLQSQENAIIAAMKTAGATADQLKTVTQYFGQQITAITDPVGTAFAKLHDTINQQLTGIQSDAISFTTSLADTGKFIGTTLINNIEGGMADTDFTKSMNTYIKNAVIQAAVYTSSLSGTMASIGAEIAEAVAGGLSSDELKNIQDELAALYKTATDTTTTATKIFAGIPGFAAGTDYFKGGMAWVGEKGPELVTLPTGSSVTPASQSAMGATIHFHSPTAIDAISASRLLLATQRRLAAEAMR